MLFPVPAPHPDLEDYTLMDTTFSFRALLRQVRDELGTGDLHRIIKEAAPRIPPEHREQAFTEAALELARTVVVSGHPQISPVSVRQGTGKLNSARSAKIAGIRRAWPELRATYACVDSSKALADYTCENLLTLADVLETQAKQTAAKAKNFRKLANLMERTSVTRVADLPDAILATVFRGEVAA